ncbi:hypothetical protein E5F05_03845 (plasmid) [Deinococcus metallilatus]|uniref:Uncharacterized protein n=2 Tax=Deinococcus metallilatus TaxID=1211322 RepID=A0AAJ5F751_9DEIO|nr:hypothetical protein E5F05_03845 [Deinococcus metallilatus]RXJ18064.1 hypothetical protein ERJ73_01495 [Deinococcus metallilatus]TLK32000.1 hypothetical protein FCS05_00610 [Deinococcus metallilatus]
MRRGEAAGMKLKPVLTLGLALSGLALAAPQRYEMQSYVNSVKKWEPAFAWCDAPDRVLAVTRPASTDPNEVQPVTFMRWLKRNPGQPYIAQYLLGPSEGAAGTVYTSLIPPGRTPHSEATPQSFVSISNVENVIDPAYRMTHVNEFKLDGKSYRCRYVPQAAFMGATNKRTVIVWDNGRAATYATRNFDGTPGVYVTGGQKRQQAEATVYEFKTGDGYTYQLKIAPQEYSGNAELSVLRQGQVIQTEPFLAYSISLPAKGQP